jgi:ketosteroid isomerase-like protein
MTMQCRYSVPDGVRPEDRGYPWHHGVVAALLAIALAAGCARHGTPEDEVRAVIDAAKQAAEARDVSGVTALLADDFRDAGGAGRDDARNMLRGYFIANQSVHLVTKVESIDFPGADLARVTATVAMAGRERDPSTALGVSASVYEFDVTLVRQGGDWKVWRAAWRPLAAN